MNTGQNKLDGFVLVLEKWRKLWEIALLENDPAAFFRAAWPIPEPAKSPVWHWVYDLLCEWLVLISSGEFRKRCCPMRGDDSCTHMYPREL